MMCDFTIDKLKFYYVDANYVEELNRHDSEVFFSKDVYDTKPYTGILVNNNGSRYLLPLTSAKPKHARWRDVSESNFLIYETIANSDIQSGYIYKRQDSAFVKHILSVLEIKKMIPVHPSLYKEIDFDSLKHSTDDADRYRYDLLSKEFRFCLNMLPSILHKTNNIYNKQIETGKVLPFHCDYKLLESVCHDYISAK